MSATAPLLRLDGSALTAAALLTVFAAGAAAERADRSRPLTLESDAPCTVNLIKQVSVCSGNVVVTQGTMQLRAGRLEMRQTPDGYQIVSAEGSAATPATYRQKRDGVDQTVEGQAQRIVYDGKADTLRLEGDAVVRLLGGARTLDEIHGRTIVWDAQAEQLSAEGGASGEANPGGRVRVVIAPREAASAASATPVPAPRTGERR